MTRASRATAPPSQVVRDLLATPGTDGSRAGRRPPPAAGSYVPWTRWGELIVVSFQLPWRDGELVHPGWLGRDLTVAQGREAARCCADNVLDQLAEAADGRLDRVALLRIEGHVACEPGFGDLASVLDAASEHLVRELGERGLHARTALGHQATPLDASVMLGTWAHLLDA